MNRNIVPLLLFVMLAGCAAPQAGDVALTRGLAPAIVDAGPFSLFTYASAFTQGAPLTVYIEGDGYGWISRFKLSDDPTPRDTTVLGMAARDPAVNLVYIARPCQYVRDADRRNCSPAYWSSARFAEEVIAATGKAIDHYKRLSGARSLRLIGYSGGGAVAALLAERRDDVRELITVAGVLDIEAWTAIRGTDPLTASLNPADHAGRLAGLRQTHFVGERDEVVPEALARSFLSHIPADGRPQPILVPGQAHEGGWAERWPALLGMIGEER